MDTVPLQFQMPGIPNPGLESHLNSVVSFNGLDWRPCPVPFKEQTGGQRSRLVPCAEIILCFIFVALFLELGQGRN